MWYMGKEEEDERIQKKKNKRQAQDYCWSYTGQKEEREREVKPFLQRKHNSVNHCVLNDHLHHHFASPTIVCTTLLDGLTIRHAFLLPQHFRDR